MRSLADDEYYELELCLSMVQKLTDGEIEVEQGKNPVDKEHAVSLYLSRALEILKGGDD